MDAERLPGPRLRRPVRRLPVADGAVLRPRPRPRPARLGRRAAMDRRGAGAQRLGDGAPARCARRAPARRRPPGRRAALHAQPLRRDLRGADLDHAAGHGGAAMAAAVRAPRTARSPRLVVAGGLRAGADLDRRRGQRRRDRVAAARAGPAGGLRAGLGCGAVGRGACVRGAARAGGGARLPVVGRGRARPRPLRPGLPALHRAAGDDLEHDLAARVAAPAGLLDELHRRWLHGHAARLPGRRGRLSGAGTGRGGDAGHPGAVPGVVRVDAARALRAVLPRARPPRPAGDVRRLPRGGTAAPRGDLHLQPRAGRALPAHELQGGAARVARPRGTRRARRARAAPAPAGRGAPRRGGAGGGRVLAAGARRRPGPPARPAPRRPRGVARRRPRPRPHAAARPARHGPARPALRLLRLGRDLRPDPARPDRSARGDALHRALRRPAGRRPAMDDRRARQPAARRAGPAAAAARPHGRRRRAAGRRRRPRAQRRRSRLLGGRGPARAGSDRARLRSAAHGPGRGGDPRAGRAPAAGPPLEGADRRHGARPAPRRGDGGRRLGAGHRRPRRLRRTADRPRAALRRRPRRGRRCATRRRAGPRS